MPEREPADIQCFQLPPAWSKLISTVPSSPVLSCSAGFVTSQCVSMLTATDIGLSKQVRLVLHRCCTQAAKLNVLYLAWHVLV